MADTYFTVTAYAPITQSGNSFFERLETTRVSYSITTARGFSTAKFQLSGPLDYLLDWFNSGLSRRIVILGPDGFTAWEGFVSKLTLSYGGYQINTSVDTLANSIYVTYTELNTAVNPPTETANQVQTATDSLSQVRYGTKEKIVSGGKATSTNALTLARTVVKQLSNPEVTQTLRTLQGSAGVLSFDLRGYAFMGDWYTYEQVVSSGTDTAEVVIRDIISNEPNGAIQTDETYWDTLSTSTELYWKRSVAWAAIRKIVDRGSESGGIGFPWVAMVYEDRHLHIKAAESVNKETGVAESSNKHSLMFRNISGDDEYTDENNQVIPVWHIRPDRIVHTPALGLYQYVTRVNVTEPEQVTLSGGEVGITLAELTNAGIL